MNPVRTLAIAYLTASICLFAPQPVTAEAEPAVHLGVATLLSGDWASLGQNIVNTVETYRRHRLRHPMQIEIEDAGISSQDGLKAYQSLINMKKVDVLIGGTSSNGTIAGAGLINSSRTVMISPVTGGSNVDRAGEYIFRIGNADVLNGINQADEFKAHGLMRVALLSEQTEYTDDVAQTFRKRFGAVGGTLVFDDVFAPGELNFKALIGRIFAAKPQAIFFPTQTGTSLAVFLKQLAELGGFKGEVHTTFTAAPNPDARKLAGDLFKGLHYLEPVYDRNSPMLLEFVKLYKQDHGVSPAIMFHTAATVDALNMLQSYLDEHPAYEREGFKNYLLTRIKNYKGLMGTYSFDAQGNADLGFVPAVME